MSRIFGEMRQIGIVVKDIEKAMRHWVEVCGVGPWFYAERLPMFNYRYKGRPYDTPHLSIALANSGDIQLELIQQRCATPSLYHDFLNAGHEGAQHWSSWPVNFHEIREKALASGWHAGHSPAPAGPSSISSKRAIPARSSRWPRRRRPACASSTRCVKRRRIGTARTRSA